MGSDDLFKKRKARKADEQARQHNKRSPYDKVLIVCEGEKTEPVYFEEIRETFRLNTANIEVDGNCGSSPISIVNHAHELHLKALRSEDVYNRVFCVFDRDTHHSFDDAIQEIASINKQLKKDQLGDQILFECIVSNPCFEYWFLLHYLPTTKPYAATPTKSAADLVIDDLKVYLPSYKKSQRGMFQQSINDKTLKSAKAHAERIYKNAQSTGETNPSTRVHYLVNYFEGLGKKASSK